MAKYELIILDADDTLFNFKFCEKMALENCFKELGVSYSIETIRLYSSINEALWKRHEKNEITQAQVRLMRFEQLNDAIHTGIAAEKLTEIYTKHLAKACVEFPESRTVVQALHDRGYRLCVMTNGVTEVQKSRLSKCSFGSLIDYVVVSGEAGANKPNREIYEYMVSKTGFSDKSGMLMVGDSLSSDIKGGMNFGIDTCWLNKNKKNAGELSPTYEIHSLEELLLILD